MLHLKCFILYKIVPINEIRFKSLALRFMSGFSDEFLILGNVKYEEFLFPKARKFFEYNFSFKHNFKSSEMQKREQISAKLTNNNPGQNLNSLHINHLNLDSHANGSVRLNVRNKSANFEYAHSGMHPNATFYQINNSTLNNNMLNTQALKPQNSLAKNFIDFNLQQQQQQQQTQLLSPGLQLTTNPTNRIASSRINSSNLKLVNESNKFLEDILAHSKRSLKQSGALPNQNLSSQRDTLNNHQGQIQSVSSTSSVASSIQLPASNLIVINRTNEEKSLFPDKLILERYFSF